VRHLIPQLVGVGVRAAATVSDGRLVYCCRRSIEYTA